MRIAQVVFPNSSAYEQKSQRVDLAALVEAVISDVERADIAHVYAPRNVASRSFRGIKVPIVASARVKNGVAISPIEEPGFIVVPEAVEEKYFKSPPRAAALHKVGHFARAALKNIVNQTAARLHRTRDDLEWLAFDRAPTPEEFASIGVWVDPAIADDDFDGFVAEAMVSGVPVVAARTSINMQRLEKGRTGLLVRRDDPNELVHAILAALFKPEVAQQKLDAVRQTISKFRPRQRLRALTRIYESL